MAPRVLLLTCCQVYQSRSAALCGLPRAPWRTSPLLFQSGLKETRKGSSSAAQTETQHQLGSGKLVQESRGLWSPPLRCLHDASMAICCHLRQDASAGGVGEAWRSEEGGRTGPPRLSCSHIRPARQHSFLFVVFKAGLPFLSFLRAPTTRRSKRRRLCFYCCFEFHCRKSFPPSHFHSKK